MPRRADASSQLSRQTAPAVELMPAPVTSPAETVAPSPRPQLAAISQPAKRAAPRSTAVAPPVASAADAPTVALEASAAPRRVSPQRMPSDWSSPSAEPAPSVSQSGAAAATAATAAAGPPVSLPGGTRAAWDRIGSAAADAENELQPTPVASAPAVAATRMAERASPPDGASAVAASAEATNARPSAPAAAAEMALRRAAIGSPAAAGGVAAMESPSAGAAAAAARHGRQAAATLPGSTDAAQPVTSASAEGGGGTDGSLAAATPLRAPETVPQQRLAGRFQVRQPATDGSGGLGPSPSAAAGVPSRRASRRSELVHRDPHRFLQRSTSQSANVSGQVRQAAPAFAQRAARREAHATDEGERPAAEVEAAIELGLGYLASIQTDQGHWSLQQTVAGGPTPSGELATIQADTAATGMALLAFLGAGYDHLDDQYRHHVARGLEFLISHQKPDGDLYVMQPGPANVAVWLYSHGIAAIALCEAYGMTGDPQLREPAQRAIDFIVAAQEPQRGGWRYLPGTMADLSVSGWQLMALRSGQLAGLEVPKDTIQRTVTLLERAQADPADGSQYVYNPWGNDTEAGRFGPRSSTVMSAVGLLMRLYTGWSREHDAVGAGADRLLLRLPEMTQPPGYAGMENPRRDTYYWYNATQVMFHMQGRHWKQWKETLYPLLAETQVRQGSLAGSWDPRQPVADRWGVSAGRLYVTALNLLSLEVYHRHLPLFSEGL